MASKVLSIYVGSDAIRIAEMQNNNKTVILSNAAEIATPDNSVNDGYLVDITAIAEAIRTSIFGRGFTAKEVIFTITSKKIASKDVEIPYVKNEKKLKQILQANSSEYFPMSNSNDYAFAFSVLENFTDEEGRKSRVSAVAAPNDLVKCYYELAEELKLSVHSIDYFGNSVIQLLSMQMTEGRTDLVLQIEKDTTFVNVMRGKTLILQRSVPYGKNAVINALMDVKKISEKDAKTLLSNEMLLDQHVTPEEYAETVQYLVSGIGRVVEYHRTKNKNDLLQGIKVFGEGSAIAGIEKILERELGAPVQHFENLAGVVIKGQAALTAEEVLRYLPNIGAVIKPIDLEVEYGESGGVNLGAGQTLKALIAVLILVLWIIAVLRLRGKVGLKIALLTFVGCAAVYVATSLMFSDLIRVISTRLTDANDLDSFTTGRVGHWKNYIDEIFGDIKIFFLGQGFTNIKLYGKSPHNTIIQLFYQLGFLGVPVLIYWTRCFFKSGRTIVGKRKFDLKILIVLIGIFLPWMAIDTLFFDEFFLFQMYALLALEEFRQNNSQKDLTRVI